MYIRLIGGEKKTQRRDTETGNEYDEVASGFLAAGMRAELTWMTARGDCEKYQRGKPNRLISAVFVSYVSEQRVLRMLPPEHKHTLQVLLFQTGWKTAGAKSLLQRSNLDSNFFEAPIKSLNTSFVQLLISLFNHSLMKLYARLNQTTNSSATILTNHNKTLYKAEI